MIFKIIMLPMLYRYKIAASLLVQLLDKTKGFKS